MPTAPLVDLIIAVHDATRPVRRAVDSVLESSGPEVRVTVVCHDLPTTDLEQQFVDCETVRVVPFRDGVRSPAGPYNHGLGIASAEYVMIMGSDDFLEPGAMRAWVEGVRRTDPDVAIVPLRYQGGDKQVNPPTRLHRTRNLDAVADRLFYRTAPIFLTRRTLIESLHLTLTEGLAVGEDMEFTSRLWTANARVEFLRSAPCYVIGSDAAGRVTAARRPMAATLAGVRHTIAAEWTAALPRRTRAALAAKLLKIHVLGEVSRPREHDAWSQDDVDELRDVARTLIAFAPECVVGLPRADRAMVDAMTTTEVDPESLLAARSVRARAGRFDLMVPRNPFRLLHREGTLARYALYRFER